MLQPDLSGLWICCPKVYDPPIFNTHDKLNGVLKTQLVRPGRRFDAKRFAGRFACFP